MSWSLSVFGHCDASAEQRLMEGLREVLTGEDVGACIASLYTSSHGLVNLLEPAEAFKPPFVVGDVRCGSKSGPAASESTIPRRGSGGTAGERPPTVVLF